MRTRSASSSRAFPRSTAFDRHDGGGLLEGGRAHARHSMAPAGKVSDRRVVAGMVHVCQSAPSQGFGAAPRRGRCRLPCISPRSTRRTGSSDRPCARSGLRLGQALGQAGARRPWRPATRHVQVRVSPAGSRVLENRPLDVRAGRWTTAYRGGRAIISPAGPAPPAARARRRWGPRRGIGRRGDRPVAFSSLAATRAWLGTDMASASCGPTGRRGPGSLETPAASRGGRSGVLPGHRPGRPHVDHRVLQKLGCWTPHVEITRPPSRWPSTSSSTRASSPSATGTRTWWRKPPAA